MAYTYPRDNLVYDFGFAVLSIDFSGKLNSFAVFPNLRPRGVYLVNGERVCEADWLSAYRNAEDISRLIRTVA